MTKKKLSDLSRALLSPFLCPAAMNRNTRQAMVPTAPSMTIGSHQDARLYTVVSSPLAYTRCAVLSTS